MRSTTTVILSLLLAISLWAAFTDQSPMAAGQGGGVFASKLTVLDTNQDGVINATEIANAPAVVRALDKNGDGQLAGDELSDVQGAPAGAGPRRADDAAAVGRTGYES